MKILWPSPRFPWRRDTPVHQWWAWRPVVTLDESERWVLIWLDYVWRKPNFCPEIDGRWYYATSQRVFEN